MPDSKKPVLLDSGSMQFTFYDEKLREFIGRDLGIDPMRVKVYVSDASDGRGAPQRYKFVVAVRETCYVHCPETGRDCTSDDEKRFGCAGSACGRMGREGTTY